MTGAASSGYGAGVLRGWPRRFVVVWVLLATFALPAVAQAEEKARLVYVRGAGAEDCPAEVDLRLWVIARLGYDPFSPQASRVVIARVEARDQQLFSSVEVADQQGLSTGQRVLESKNERCQELARAMALSISLAVDPERASVAHAEPVAAPAPPAPAPSPPPAPAPEPDPPAVRPERPSPHVFARVAFEGGLGQVPGGGIGGGLGLGLRFRRASLALEGHGALALGSDLTPRGDLNGSLIAAGVVGCAHFGPLGLCAVGYAGEQRLGTSDVARPNTSSGLYLGVGPRVALELAVTRRLALTTALEGLLNARRNSAILTGREVWKAPALGATLSIGAAAHFL